MFFNVKATEGVNTCLKASSKVAIKFNNGEIASEHLLYGLTFNEQSLSAAVLKEFNVTSTLVLDFLNKSTSISNSTSAPKLSERANKIIKIASNLSSDLGGEFMGTEHLLFALMVDNSSVANALLEKVFNVNILALKRRIAVVLGLEEANDNAPIETAKIEEAKTGANSNLEEELLTMGTDLTLKAVNGKIDPIIGRQKEINEVIETLCRKGKNNPVLVGLAGVGKSAIVEGLALKIVSGDVPEELQNKIVYSLDIGSLMAGTRYRGALEEKLKNVIDILLNRRDIILFIDEIHTLMQAGDDKSGVSPANMLKPHLARGDLQTVGATTIDEYKKFIEKDKAIERRLQTIMVNPPTKDETIQILNRIKISYEKFHNVNIADEAIKAAVELSERYITDRNLPDKAIDLIDQASSKARIGKNSLPRVIKEKQQELESLTEDKKRAMSSNDFVLAGKIRDKITVLSDQINKLQSESLTNTNSINLTVGEDQIAHLISNWTGIPVTKITQTEKDKLLNLETILHEKVIGQDEAVEAVSKAIRRARAGLKDQNRPIGSFIFVGQTGLGKTHLARRVAEVMFEDENKLIRFDMSEYMESHSVAKLIGAPAGYVGHDEGGLLTDAVRQNPYTVLLFDEIEKAHKDVFNLMLQVLEDGRLTDSKGRTVDFKNCIIIFTSNAGVNKIKSAKELTEANGEEFDFETLSATLKAELKNTFKPEFLNRIDEITVFRPFNKTELAHITKIMIVKLVKKLKAQGLNLKLTENAFKNIIEKGTSSEYGARALRRVIEHEIEDKIAEELLKNNFDKNETIIIDLVGENLQIKY